MKHITNIFKGLLAVIFSIHVLVGCGSPSVTPDPFDPDDYEIDYKYDPTPYDVIEEINIDNELTLLSYMDVLDYLDAVDTAMFLDAAPFDPRDDEGDAPPPIFRKMVELPQEGLVHVAIVLGNGKIKFYVNGEIDEDLDMEFVYEAGSPNLIIAGEEMTLSDLYDLFYLNNPAWLGWALSDEENFKLYNCINAKAAVVAKYSFETIYIDSIEDSVGENDGDVSGDVEIIEHTGNNVAYFDGKNDYVSVPHSESISFAEEFTISAWLNAKIKDNRDHVIISKGNNRGFNYHVSHKSNKIRFRYTDAVSGQTETITVNNLELENNEWYFVAIRVNSEGFSFFINGEKIFTEEKAISLQENTGDLTIGHDSLRQTKAYDGMMDDLRLFNVALSDNEIKAVYLSYFCCLNV